MKSRLDLFYSWISNRNRFFNGGWGNVDGLFYLLNNHPKKIHNRPVDKIIIHWNVKTIQQKILIQNGYFESPFRFEYRKNRNIHSVTLPEESKIAHLQLILPKEFTKSSPLVLHFAATGDQGFSRRRLTLALPLAKKGIGSILLENPFYGRRKPKKQNGVYIDTFTEFLTMSRAATDEGIAILEYFANQGFKNLGVTGISMGGYTALTTAARSKLNLAVTACVPCHSGSPVYLEGALNRACDWNSLNLNIPVKNLKAEQLVKKLLDISDLRHFPIPKMPERVFLIGALYDAYIPRYSTELIKAHLPDSHISWIPTGHVGSLLFYASSFRNVILKSFQK